MHTLPLSDIAAGHGDVFADNLMLCSADRLLVSRYASFAEDAAFDGGPTAAMLLGHDVLNLGALVDVLLCHDHVYVNAEYIDRWSSGESRLVEQLRNHVTAVETEPDFR